MKYVLGGLALIAAVIIVGCSATTLFLTAFNSVNEPWQQWLQGAGIAAIVAWEAAAVLIIGYCFKTRHWATGLGAVLLLVLAMAVTSRQELRLYLGGQADVTASRTVTADDRSRVRAELDRAYDRRDTLQAKDKLTKFQEADLADVKARIKALEDRWDTQTIDVKASGHAEGDFARKLFGFDADLAQMFLDTLPLWFWMVARVFSISAAVAAILAMWHETAKEARTQPEDDLGVIVVRGTVTAPPAPAPRAEMRPISPALAKLAGVAEPNLSENPISSNLPENPVSSDHFRDLTKLVPDPDGPGTPMPNPASEEMPESNVVDHPAKQKLLGTDHPTKAEMKIRKGHPETKDFIRDCLGIDREALAAMLSAIRGKKALDVKIARRLKPSSDCWDMYTDWCEEHNFSAISPKAFSNQLGTAIGLPKGTKLKGIKGIRNAQGMKFPVFDARAAEPMRRTA